MQTKMSEEEVRRIMFVKHEAELKRVKEEVGIKKSIHRKSEIDHSMFEISNETLVKEINKNRNIFLYSKNWLFDKDYTFFFNYQYHEKMRNMRLNWRHDYSHLLMVRFMSYHNIGKSF